MKHPTLKKSDWIALVVFNVFLFMTGLWTIDISVSSMLTGAFVRGLLYISSDPTINYHIGLCLVAVSFMFIVLIAIHHILRGE
jgi:hypothetical protein